MSNKKYWEDRMANSQKIANKGVLKPMKKVYKEAYSVINRELENLWLELLEGGEISQSALFKSQRYRQLQSLIQEQLYKVGVAEVDALQMSLLDVYAYTYGEMEKYSGIPLVVNEQVAKSIVNENYKGATFSDRVWADMGKLRNNIEKSVVESAVVGRDVRKVAKELQNKMGSSYSDCKRITITETSRVMNEGCRQSALETGLFTHYRFLAEKDDRTCDECMEYDGNEYPLDDTYHLPPLHPNSRSTILIVIPE